MYVYTGTSQRWRLCSALSTLCLASGLWPDTQWRTTACLTTFSPLTCSTSTHRGSLAGTLPTVHNTSAGTSPNIPICKAQRFLSRYAARTAPRSAGIFTAERVPLCQNRLLPKAATGTDPGPAFAVKSYTTRMHHQHPPVSHLAIGSEPPFSLRTKNTLCVLRRQSYGHTKLACMWCVYSGRVVTSWSVLRVSHSYPPSTLAPGQVV